MIFSIRLDRRGIVRVGVVAVKTSVCLPGGRGGLHGDFVPVLLLGIVGRHDSYVSLPHAVQGLIHDALDAPLLAAGGLGAGLLLGLLRRRLDRLQRTLPATVPAIRPGDLVLGAGGGPSAYLRALVLQVLANPLGRLARVRLDLLRVLAGRARQDHRHFRLDHRRDHLLVLVKVALQILALRGATHAHLAECRDTAAFVAAGCLVGVRVMSLDVLRFLLLVLLLLLLLFLSFLLHLLVRLQIPSILLLLDSLQLLQRVVDRVSR